MAEDTGSTHDFLSLGGDEELATRPAAPAQPAQPQPQQMAAQPQPVQQQPIQQPQQQQQMQPQQQPMQQQPMQQPAQASTGHIMLNKPEIQPGHVEPAVPPMAMAAAGAAVGAAAGAAAGQPSSNQQAYAKLKADRAAARAERHRKGKKKVDPLEAKLTNIEKEQDDINKKYAEGSGSGLAILLIACFILIAVLAWLGYTHGDQLVETFKTTPWFRYIWIVVAMYSYANSKY